jgi:protein subunit release factor A
MSDLITLPRATVQQALEALKCLVEAYEMSNTIRADIMDAEEAITALKAALEQLIEPEDNHD